MGAIRNHIFVHSVEFSFIVIYADTPSYSVFFPILKECIYTYHNEGKFYIVRNLLVFTFTYPLTSGVVGAPLRS